MVLFEELIARKLKSRGFRVTTDLRNEKISYKVREHATQKIPYLIILGDKEREANNVSVRARENVNLGVMSLNGFEAILNDAIAKTC